MVKEVMDSTMIFTATAWVLPVLLAITLHEAAHGWMAGKFGDDTARMSGRVTFNPLKHIDPVGTVILPGLLLLARSPVLFGFAKPVPVNFNRLKPERLGMVAVAFAGPGINLLMALASALLLHFETPATLEQSWVGLNLRNALIINCALAAFNMLPLLPLDGGRVLYALLPGKIRKIYALTERYGMFLIIGLLVIPAWLGVDIFMHWLAVMVNALIQLMLMLTGHSL